MLISEGVPKNFSYKGTDKHGAHRFVVGNIPLIILLKDFIQMGPSFRKTEGQSSTYALNTD